MFQFQLENAELIASLARDDLKENATVNEVGDSQF
jgi:hypothetical protein